MQVQADESSDESSRKLPKRLVFQRKSVVGDFRKRTLSDATQPDKLLQQVNSYSDNCTNNWVIHVPFLTGKAH